ncbi:MAG: PEP/pyruvate-binding domain-containing protein [Candidatus Paceibacterota bacterium]
MINNISEIRLNTVLGSKARHLLELKQSGYQVPDFVCLTASEINILIDREGNFSTEKLTDLASYVIEKFSQPLYAVRSAAVVEDGKNNSYAGQFKTILEVTPEDLSMAIREVVLDAYRKLGSINNNFSVIIQQYVLPDYAGVIYTRSPLAGREMVLEYRKGLGDKVVGGEKVERLDFLYPVTKTYSGELGFVKELAKKAKELEVKFNFPQDIEWLAKDGVVYLLQTRPITSLSGEMWQGMQLVEKELQKEQSSFFYEKTALSETFSSPTPLAFSLLTHLYKDGGPVAKAYQRIGVRYVSTNNLRLLANELYVDKEQEIKSIYPAFSYLKHKTTSPKFVLNGGLFTTIRNFIALNSVSHSKHYESLKIELEKVVANLPIKVSSVSEATQIIDKYYELVFLINIFATQVVANLELNLGQDKVFIAQLFKSDSVNQDGNEKGLIGNSFNLDDTSDFVSFETSGDYSDNFQEESWWQKLPNWKQRGLKTYIDKARKYSGLREQARYLSVLMVNLLRTQVLQVGKRVFGDEEELIYFACLNEILEDKLVRDICQERKLSFAIHKGIETPSYLASFVKSKQDRVKSVGVSGGVTEGTVVSLNNMSDTVESKILLVDVLSPDLVQYFPQVNGIISKEGGLLSHLAIMARESHLPVVVTNDKVDIMLGKTVVIDGGAGTVVIK